MNNKILKSMEGKTVKFTSITHFDGMGEGINIVLDDDSIVIIYGRILDISIKNINNN